MDMKDRVKKALQAKGVRVVDEQAQEGPKQAQGRPQKTQHGKSPKPSVTHACGHARTIKEVEGSYCPACIKATRQKAIQRKAERRKAQEAKVGGSQDSRLPDGAVFSVTYSAERTMWGGCLVIGSQNFQGEASGVFKLLEQLDRKYRESLEKKE